LTDDEAAGLTKEIHDIVQNDRYPLSPRIRIPRGNTRQAQTRASPQHRALTIRISSLCPARPRNDGKAGKAHAEQRDRGRLGYGYREFGDEDLAVAGLEISRQDLVRTGVEGAAATTRTITH
jgi:hypothetical protein